MTADRRQRCPQLVGHRHQEVALHLLDLREARRHLPEPLAQMAELARRVLRDRDVVVAMRDRVGGVGELQNRPHDPVARDTTASSAATSRPRMPAIVSRSIRS